MKNLSGGFLIFHCDQQMNLYDMCLESPFFPVQASKFLQRGISPHFSPFLRNTDVLGQITGPPQQPPQLVVSSSHIRHQKCLSRGSPGVSYSVAKRMLLAFEAAARQVPEDLFFMLHQTLVLPSLQYHLSNH